MQILKVNDREMEVIQSGNLLALKDKVKEAEEFYFLKLKMEKSDYRHVQGVYAVLSDLLEILT